MGYMTYDAAVMTGLNEGGSRGVIRSLREYFFYEIEHRQSGRGFWQPNRRRVLLCATVQGTNPEKTRSAGADFQNGMSSSLKLGGGSSLALSRAIAGAGRAAGGRF